MSTGTETDIKGKFDEVAGKVKQALGEATNNEKLANEGTAQQVKGHGEQAWGSVKEAASEKYDETKARHEASSEHTSQTGHDIREKIASTAANVKEHIQHAVGKDKE